MGLIVFNKLNCAESLSRKPKLAKVRVSKTLGIVYLNSTAMDILGMKPGEYVEFLFDDSKPVSWYISKSDSEKGLVIAKNSASGKVNNKKVALSIHDTYLPGVDAPVYQLAASSTMLSVDYPQAWCILNKIIVDER